MRILVTGHAGFIGRYLTEALIGQGHCVIGLDKKQTISQIDSLTSHTCNILYKKAVIETMTGIDAIIHLAAEHQDWGISREEYFKVNQIGTRTLLECATDLHIRQFIFYSSVAVYGTSIIPTTEKTIPHPDNDYGESKLAAEKEVESWSTQDPLNCAIIVRPTVVFGPRMNTYSNIYRLVDQIAKHHFFYIGKMSNIKSLAYVENIVDATLWLWSQIKPGVQVYNYTEPDHLTSRQIATYIAKFLSVWTPPVSLPYKPVLAVTSILDLLAKYIKVDLPITAARIKKVNISTHHRSDKLRFNGFKPKWTIYEGLDKSCQWYIEASL